MAAIRAVDQSQRTAPSDQSQQWEAGFRETSRLRIIYKLGKIKAIFWEN